MNWVTKGFTTEQSQIAVADKKKQPEPIATVTEPECACGTCTGCNPKEQASAVLFDFQTPQQATQVQTNLGGFNSAFAGNTIGNRQILVIAPRNDGEVISIVEHLKTNEAVIINFEGMPLENVQRRLDFLSGVACGLGGVIRPLDANKFIMTPSGIGVKE